ncbi:membrane protein insertion efficiency factor YidD [Duganella sp. Leaf126]|uniref:membrane protein insertion efficiency factor YidD n=1 Tax=Duganella sp. Leaf126 TaxID=1736266 RepID=UPI0009E7C8DC
MRQWRELVKGLALATIKFYQRNISPHKGFRCAYAAYTSDASCSTFGYRAIRRFGLWDGLFILNRRLSRCGTAHRIANGAQPRPIPMPKRRQSGHIDCGGCAISSCDADTLLCASNVCSCDWPVFSSRTSPYREAPADNAEAVKRRSRLLRDANKPTDPPNA